jgi:hypothetical protein
VSNWKSNLKVTFEVFSVVAPILCLIDCVVLPILIAVLPFLGQQHLLHGLQDQTLALIVVAMCTPVIVPGFMKHRKSSVLILFGMGIALMLFANWTELSDQIFHVCVSMVASGCLIKANLDNKRFLAKACPCFAHHEHH